MSYTIHVNGAARIAIGVQGAFANSSAQGWSALDFIGFTDGGPTIDISFHTEPVFSDNAGPVVPSDFQLQGQTATINMACVVYDDTILRTSLLPAIGTEGVMAATGALVFQSGYGNRIVIESPIDNVVWRFPWTTTMSARLRPGSKYNIYDISVAAIPYVANGDSLNGKVLFDRLNV